MYEIRCFVDDKKLAHVGHLLDGQVYEIKMTPVRGAQAKNGKVQAVHNGSAVEAVMIGLRKGSTLAMSDVKAKLKAAGYNPQSSGNVLNRLAKAKAIKRIGKGKYEVTRG